MHRFDEILDRQKNGMLLDMVYAVVLCLAIGIGAMGVAKTLEATTGWENAGKPTQVASLGDTAGSSAVIARGQHEAH